MPLVSVGLNFKTPFIQKFLGTCKSKLSGGEALLKIEQLKEAADNALVDVLEKCNCKKGAYRITNKLKNRLIELAGLFYLKSNELISKKDFIKLYSNYTNKYYGSRASKIKYSKKDVQQTSRKIINTIFQKNMEKGLSNVFKSNNVKTLKNPPLRRNIRRTSGRNVRRTSGRNNRRTSGRNVRRTSGRNVRRTSGRNVRRTSRRNIRRKNIIN